MGRPKGAKNKPKLGSIAAAKIINEARNSHGKQVLGKDVLERLILDAMEWLKEVEPPKPSLVKKVDLIDGEQPTTLSPEAFATYGAWFDRAAYCAKELAKYQSPTFKAIAVAPTPTQQVQERRFTLRIFDRQRSIDPLIERKLERENSTELLPPPKTL